MLPRVLEAEVMDTIDEAIDYDAMDHSTVNRAFVDDFLTALSLAAKPRDGVWKVFDAGTGTALIPLELASRGVPVRIVAADAAVHMLELARRNIAKAGKSAAIECVQRDCKRLPDAEASFDAVMSNSIVHHIPEPKGVLAECWRILRPGGLLFIRDLMRPSDATTLEQLVNQYAGDANPHQQQMFRDSLHAALTVEEVAAVLHSLGIPAQWVRATSDRHWTIRGVKA